MVVLLKLWVFNHPYMTVALLSFKGYWRFIIKTLKMLYKSENKEKIRVLFSLLTNCNMLLHLNVFYRPI